jgi:hypothetical protein
MNSMSEQRTSAEILLTPPGAVTPEDREALRAVGVIVVETEDPHACQFLRSGEVISSSDMLWAAMDALRRDYGYGDHGSKQREQLAHNLFSLIATTADHDGSIAGKVRARRKASEQASK